jgi:hypothetical protein
VAVSLNVTRSPEQRERLLSGELHRVRCTGCGEPNRIETNFSYFDLDRRQLFMVFPPGDEPRWAELERAPTILRDRNLAGDAAPAFARQLGAELQLRTVFGLDALREKVLLFEAGLDDVAVELTKLAWMRGGGLGRLVALERPRARVVDEQTLRLVTASGATMVVDLAGLRAQGSPQGEVADRLRAGPYVDVGRLFL